MPKAFQTWNPLPHEPWVKLAENLWWIRGTLPGMSLKRVMTVARLADGSLVIHNGIALAEAEQRELEQFGNPKYLIVPNGGHRLDAFAYKERYPSLTVLCPEGSRSAVEDVIKVDGTYDDFPANETVRMERLQGVAHAEGVMLVHSPDGTSVVLNDVMFNMDRKRDVLGFFFTTILGSAPGPRVSRLAKLVYVKDKAQVRAEFLRLAEIPDLVRVIVAHEKVASGPEARAALLRASTYL
jgi:hypothetical protein